MAVEVYNPIGGTVDEPCPTAIGRWFDRSYCSQKDYEMWLQGAANLYEFGILPTWAVMNETAANAGATQIANELSTRAEKYRNNINNLRRSGSVFSPARNLELVSQVVLLMQEGSALLDLMDANIRANEGAPPELAIPEPPTETEKKSPLARYAWPAAIAGGGALVLGLTIWAIASAKSEPEGKRRAA